MPDHVITTHEGLDIRFNPVQEHFWAVVDGSTTVTAKTLSDVKKKIDNYKRALARAQAADLPAVVLEISTDWESGDRVKKGTWRRGAFASANAHTGDLQLKLKNGHIEKVDARVWWFAAGNPAIAEIERQLAVTIEAERAAAKAGKALQALLDTHGMQVQLGRYRGQGTAAASAAEQALIEHLGGKPAIDKEGK